MEWESSRTALWMWSAAVSSRLVEGVRRRASWGVCMRQGKGCVATDCHATKQSMIG